MPRRPAPPLPPSPAAVVADAPDEGLILGRYRLTGVVVTPSLRIIFVSQPGSGRKFAVEEGEELDGWLVAEVERHVIVLTSGDRRETIPIRERAAVEGPAE